MKINDDTKWSDIAHRHFIQTNNEGVDKIIEDNSVRICSLEFIDTGCGEQMFNVEIEQV